MLHSFVLSDSAQDEGHRAAVRGTSLLEFEVLLSREMWVDNITRRVTELEWAVCKALDSDPWF